MTIKYNIYCDESCHLENDGYDVMMLGAIWCPMDRVREIAVAIRDIKKKHGLKPHFEIKWTKVSSAKIDFYFDLLKYFFKEDNLHFRALVVPDKSILNHAKYKQDHDTWYYKMYFDMLKWIFSPDDEYNIYLDIKDTCSSEKTRKLHKVISNSLYDFDRKIVKKIQTVQSKEIEQVQLADLFIGAIGYVNRELKTSPAKVEIAQRLKTLSGYSLKQTTLIRETKFNLLVWEPRGKE